MPTRAQIEDVYEGFSDFWSILESNTDAVRTKLYRKYMNLMRLMSLMSLMSLVYFYTVCIRILESINSQNRSKYTKSFEHVFIPSNFGHPEFAQNRVWFEGFGRFSVSR